MTPRTSPARKALVISAIEQGFSMWFIATQLNMAHDTVKNIAKRDGLSTREVNESRWKEFIEKNWISSEDNNGLV